MDFIKNLLGTSKNKREYVLHESMEWGVIPNNNKVGDIIFGKSEELDEFKMFKLTSKNEMGDAVIWYGMVWDLS